MNIKQGSDLWRMVEFKDGDRLLKDISDYTISACVQDVDDEVLLVADVIVDSEKTGTAYIKLNTESLPKDTTLKLVLTYTTNLGYKEVLEVEYFGVV
jgi:uncharacterized protein (UPF0128 family)